MTLSIDDGAGRTIRRFMQVVGLVIALFAFEQNGEYFAGALGIHPTAGTLSGKGELRISRAGPTDSFVAVRVDPASPLGAAGVEPGDQLLFDDPVKAWAKVSTGERIGLTVAHAGARRHAVLQPAPLVSAPNWPSAAQAMAYVVCDAFGALLLLWGYRRSSALQLGLALSAFSIPTLRLQPLLAGTSALVPGCLFILSCLTVANFAFMAFALTVERRIGAAGRIAFGVAALAGLVSVLTDAPIMLLLLGGPALTSFSSIETLYVGALLPLIATLGLLVDAVRRADAATWRGHANLVVGFGLIVAAQALTVLGLALRSGALIAAGNYGQTFTSILCPLLMAHAVLGKRVIDVGLAVNRTLVYGLISLVILICFGLAEWAISFFAPIRGRGANAALGAALALVVSLTFHSIHRFADDAVERVFFRRWRAREEELRAFLREAPFFKRQEALTAAALAALRRFAEDTAVAIYQRAPGGDFLRLDGCVEGFTDRLDGEVDLLVRLRAHKTPIKAGAASLAVPMATRNELNGAIILGCRPDGADWRPDQIQELSVAARHLGHDLQVLELDHLQAEVDALTQKLAEPPRSLLSALTRLRS